jgi:hypothetical protein
MNNWTFNNKPNNVVVTPDDSLLRGFTRVTHEMRLDLLNRQAHDMTVIPDAVMAEMVDLTNLLQGN